MPKSRCGATVSSISVDSGMRSNGAPEEESCGDLGQNFAAALRLLAQGLEIAGELFVAINGLFELARNQEDRRQRRAEFVGGSGSKAVDLGEMLLAGQHQFGRRQCVGQFAGPPR